MVRRLVVVLAVILPWFAFGQSFVGPRTFPQFRKMDGLSGDGFGVLRDGTIDISGAMALSTPIAYTLQPGQLVMGLCSRSIDSQFRWVNVNSGSQSNLSSGSAQVIGAIKTPLGNLTLSHLVLSSRLDSVQNAQFTFAHDWQGTTWSLGVHNFTGRGQAAGDNDPINDLKYSESFFLVGTREVSPQNYLTLGVGTTRFRGPFGSYSGKISDRYRFFGEYDTFNWNYGVATEFKAGSKKGFISAGFIRGNLATWTVNFVF